jgi:hypothetical protein
LSIPQESNFILEEKNSAVKQRRKKGKAEKTAQKERCFSFFHQHPDTRACKRKRDCKRKTQKAEKWLDKAKKI